MFLPSRVKKFRIFAVGLELSHFISVFQLFLFLIFYKILFIHRKIRNIRYIKYRNSGHSGLAECEKRFSNIMKQQLRRKNDGAASVTIFIHEQPYRKILEFSCAHFYNDLSKKHPQIFNKAKSMLSVSAFA